MSEYTGNGTQKDLGKLEARQDAVETRLATIERNVEQILLYVTTIKGLSHILIGIGTVATIALATVELVRAFK